MIVRTARLVTLITGLALLVVALPAGALGQTGSERLPGFTGERSAEQLQAEARFQRAISARRAGRISRTLSARPQLIGSPGLADALDYSVDRLSRTGCRWTPLPTTSTSRGRSASRRR